ncbi:MAG: thymidylate kinase [Patescibacteria group bacterium]|nr:thymidylate kinase [Patescibacteria group bacterium]
MSDKRNGLFVVIDGPDGTGKHTQVVKLEVRMHAENLEPIEQASFPRYGERSCELVKMYLGNEFGPAASLDPRIASVFFAVDRFAARQKMVEVLSAGGIILSDRFVSANAGHQCCKIDDPDARRAFLRWLDEFEFGLMQLPRPDITLILTLPLDIIQRRLQARDGDKQDGHQADPNHLARALIAYEEIAQQSGYRRIDCAPGGRELSEQEVHELIWREVEPLYRAHRPT